jgi:hypothetical protein
MDISLVEESGSDSDSEEGQVGLFALDPNSVEPNNRNKSSSAVRNSTQLLL